VPGPISRTMPEAVLRSGGIRADEFLLFVGVNSSESVVGVDVVGWDGVSGMSQGLGLFFILRCIC
jgi:hypothetical protein